MAMHTEYGVAPIWTFCRICALALTVATPVLSAGPPASDESSTEALRLVREVRGIRIFHRAVPGSVFPEGRAHAIIEASPARVYAVVHDYDHFAEFLPYVKDSKTLKEDGEVRWVHQRLRFPGPIAEREFVLRIVHHTNVPRENFFLIEWRLDDEETRALSQRSGIVPTSFSGFWELGPNPEGTGTDATYAVHLDPGGALPVWVVKIATNHFLPAVIEAIRDQVLSSGSRTLSVGVTGDCD